MSSSSSDASVRTGRVIRGAEAPRTTVPDGFGMDLGTEALRRLDPRRVEEAVAEGRATGYAQGWQAGLVAGQSAAAAELASVREQLDLVVGRAAQAVEASLERADAAWTDLTAQATGLAFALVEVLVGRELAVAVDPGADAVRRALTSVPAGGGLVVRLHPDDAAALAAGDLPTDRGCTIVPDPTLARGDCIADTDATHVDARIATALERVRAVLGVEA